MDRMDKFWVDYIVPLNGYTPQEERSKVVNGYEIKEWCGGQR